MVIYNWQGYFSVCCSLPVIHGLDIYDVLSRFFSPTVSAFSIREFAETVLKDRILVLGTQGEHDHEVNQPLPINKQIAASEASKIVYL